MPTTVISSIGTRAAETVTVNTGTQVTVGSATRWNLVLSSAPSSDVAIGDKIALVITATTYYYRITDISGSTLTVSKYWGSKADSGWTSQPDPTTANISGPQAGCDITRAFALPNTTGYWEDSAPADLTTATVDGVSGGCIWKGEMWDDGGDFIDVTTGISLAGSTTSSSCYKWITAAPGRSWHELLSTSALRPQQSIGAGINNTSNALCRFRIDEPYGIIENLVRTNTAATQASGGAHIALDAVGAAIRKCLIEIKNNSSYAGAIVELAGTSSSFHDNIVLLTGAATADTMLSLGATGSSTSDATAPAAFNCIFARPSDLSASSTRGIRMAGSAGTKGRLQNCGFFGISALFYNNVSTTFTADSGNNITDLAEGSTTYTDRFPPGTNCKYAADITGSWGTANNLFVNTTVASGDWRQVAGSPMENAGQRVTTPTNHADTTGGTSGTRNNPASYGGTGDKDILGSQRSTTTPWIGAHQVAQAGAGAALAGAITITSSASANLTKYSTFVGDIAATVVLSGNMSQVARLILDLVTRNGSPQADLTGIKYAIYSGTTVDSLGSLLTSGTAETTDGSGRIEIEVPTANRGSTVMVMLQSSDGTKFYIGTKVLG